MTRTASTQRAACSSWPPVHLAEHRTIARGRDAQPVLDGAHWACGGRGRSGQECSFQAVAPTDAPLDPGFREAQLLGLQRDNGGPPEPGRQQQQQRSVPLAGEIAAAGLCHSSEHCRVGRGHPGPAWCGAAGLAEDSAHARFGAGRAEAPLAVLVVDGGQPSGEGSATGAGRVEEGGD